MDIIIHGLSTPHLSYQRFPSLPGSPRASEEEINVFTKEVEANFRFRFCEIIAKIESFKWKIKLHNETYVKEQNLDFKWHQEWTMIKNDDIKEFEEFNAIFNEFMKIYTNREKALHEEITKRIVERAILREAAANKVGLFGKSPSTMESCLEETRVALKIPIDKTQFIESEKDEKNLETSREIRDLLLEGRSAAGALKVVVIIKEALISENNRLALSRWPEIFYYCYSPGFARIRIPKLIKERLEKQPNARDCKNVIKLCEMVESIFEQTRDHLDSLGRRFNITEKTSANELLGVHDRDIRYLINKIGALNQEVLCCDCLTVETQKAAHRQRSIHKWYELQAELTVRLPVFQNRIEELNQTIPVYELWHRGCIDNISLVTKRFAKLKKEVSVMESWKLSETPN